MPVIVTGDAKELYDTRVVNIKHLCDCGLRASKKILIARNKTTVARYYICSTCHTGALQKVYCPNCERLAPKPSPGDIQRCFFCWNTDLVDWERKEEQAEIILTGV